MNSAIWHYLENQFENSTRNSRKRMNILLNDHMAKLVARSGEHATITGLIGATQAVVTSWSADYSGWRNKQAAYHSATRVLEALLVTLVETPNTGGRSKIDEWESKIVALWPASHEMYVFFFPQGRAPFTSGGRDNIIEEVRNLGTRLGSKVTELAVAAATLQAQVDAITGGGGTPPQELLDALDEANDRSETVSTLSTRVTSFGVQLRAARDDQQGKEGLVDAAATLAEEERVKAARRLYANLSVLMGHFVLLPGEDPDPQVAAGDFFDLDTLMQTGEDEEPVEGGGTGGGGTTPP